MKKKILVPLLLVGAMVVAAGAGLATAFNVKAQAATATTTTDTTTNNSIPGKGMRGGYGVTDQNLADALGITTDQLTAAKTAALNDAVSQAVAAGQITQAQGDKIISNGRFEDLSRYGATGYDYNALLAKALNITTDQLAAANTKAKEAAVAQAVADGKMTQEQADLAQGRQALANNSDFKTAMINAFTAAVNQAVSSGVITQAQADAILNAFNAKNTSTTGPAFDFGLGGGFDGGRGGRGGHGMGGDWTKPGSQSNDNGTNSVAPSSGL